MFVYCLFYLFVINLLLIHSLVLYCIALCSDLCCVIVLVCLFFVFLCGCLLVLFCFVCFVLFCLLACLISFLFVCLSFYFVFSVPLDTTARS